MVSKVRDWFSPKGSAKDARKETWPYLEKSLRVLEKWRAMRLLSGDEAQGAYIQLLIDEAGERSLASSLRYVLLVHSYALTEQEKSDLCEFVATLYQGIGSRENHYRDLLATLAVAVSVVACLLSLAAFLVITSS